MIKRLITSTTKSHRQYIVPTFWSAQKCRCSINMLTVDDPRATREEVTSDETVEEVVERLRKKYSDTFNDSNLEFVLLEVNEQTTKSVIETEENKFKVGDKCYVLSDNGYISQVVVEKILESEYHCRFTTSTEHHYSLSVEQKDMIKPGEEVVIVQTETTADGRRFYHVERDQYPKQRCKIEDIERSTNTPTTVSPGRVKVTLS